MKKICFLINSCKLYLEQVLVELDFPILYTCIDEQKQRYMILCVDFEAGEYIITQIDDVVLFEMLNRQITMRNIFMIKQCIYYVTLGDSINEDIVELKSPRELKEEQLPAKGAFFEICNKETIKYKDEIKKSVIPFVKRPTIKTGECSCSYGYLTPNSFRKRCSSRVLRVNKCAVVKSSATRKTSSKSGNAKSGSRTNYAKSGKGFH